MGGRPFLPPTSEIDTSDRPRRRPRALLAGLLSALVPGAGHLYAGSRWRGAALLGLTAAVAAVAAVGLVRGPDWIVAQLVRPGVLLVLLALNGVLLLVRAHAVVDAYRVARRRSPRPLRRERTGERVVYRRERARGSRLGGLRLAAIGLIVAFTAAPHVIAGYYAYSADDVITSVFAADGDDSSPALPDDVVLAAPTPASPVSAVSRSAIETVAACQRGECRATAQASPAAVETGPARRRSQARSWEERGRVNILLLGGDAGYGRSGLRTDTMMVASIDVQTGSAAIFGIPRNLVQVPLPSRLARVYGHRFQEILNALYAYGVEHPQQFPGGKDPGATALKEAMAQLLGIPIDYYALVDLRGFVGIVDALGGVDLVATDRVQDRVSPPGPGEPWIRIDVQAGKSYHLDGRTALAYARSRWASSDFNRMRRQRCIVSAVAEEASLTKLLRAFPRIAEELKRNVTTDVPRGEVAGLLRAVARLDTSRSAAVSLGPPDYASALDQDGYPIPDVVKIRRVVRQLTELPPAKARARLGLESVHAGCR
ncbi:MAG: LCP family protein [Thermoleophilia bacterium]